MRWSGVHIDEWWRNEQFWVIGGVSAHLFALFQGLLKVLAGIDTNFTVTSKSGEDEDFGELYAFKWTALLIPPTTLLIVNLIGVVAGISDAVNNGYQSWGPLFGKLFFAFWVIVHLYPFLKGLMGRQNRTPTIIVVWSILLASIFSLLWVRIDPFLAKSSGPSLVQCGATCWGTLTQWSAADIWICIEVPNFMFAYIQGWVVPQIHWLGSVWSELPVTHGVDGLNDIVAPIHV